MVLCSFVLYGIDIDALYRNAFKFGLVWYYLFLLDKNIVVSRKCRTQHIKKKKKDKENFNFQIPSSHFLFIISGKKCVSKLFILSSYMLEFQNNSNSAKNLVFHEIGFSLFQNPSIWSISWFKFYLMVFSI